MPDVAFPVLMAPHELFFTVTDAEGVIIAANSTFVRLSGYSWEELQGQPLGVVGHDQMPSAVYRRTWQALRAGQAYCGYVVNRSAAGRPWVSFQTITPVGDHYLNVHVPGLVAPLRDVVLDAYAETRSLEHGLSSHGLGPEMTAAQGQVYLTALMEQHGLGDPRAFMEQALPEEVKARAAIAEPLPIRVGLTPLHDLLEVASSLDTELYTWTAQLQTLAELIDSLRSSRDDLLEVVSQSSVAAEHVCDAMLSSRTTLAVEVWTKMIPEVRDNLEHLLEDLGELASSCARLRFRIALARLLNDALASFLLEQVDAGRTPVLGSGTAAVEPLVQALHESVTEALELSRRNDELGVSVAERIDEMRVMMQIPLAVLSNWRQASAIPEDDGLADLMPLLSRYVGQTERAVAALVHLAGRVRRRTAALPDGVMRRELALAEASLEDLSRGTTARESWSGPVVGARGIA